MNEIPPWEADPRLTERAIMMLLKRLCEVRHGVVQALDTESGDSAYGIGCVFYERSRAAIISDAQVYEWLTIVDESLRFVFAINGVPLRIFRAQENEPVPYKARLRGPAEREAVQECLFPEMYEDGAADWFWRVRLITDPEDEEVLKVAVEEVNEAGDVRHRWLFRADQIASYDPEANVRSLLREPVDVPDLEVGLPAEGIRATAGQLPANSKPLSDDDVVLDGAADGEE